MNTELEQRLRADMERATQGVRVPPGLALKAYRHYRKRTKAARVWTAAGAAATLTAGALTVAGVMFSGRSAGGQQVQADAYVISRVERALSPARMNNMIGRTRTVYPAGVVLQPVPGGMNGSGRPGTGSPHSGGYALAWAYHHTSKLSAFTASGQRVFGERLIVANGSLDTTVVNYTSHTWWTAAQPRPAIPSSAGCVPGGGIRLGGGGSAWPDFIRSQLACGAYAVVGRQAAGGVSALKIAASSGHFTLWVNQATYLPIRLKSGPITITFQWMSATPANLAQLSMPIPAGFHQAPPPS